MLKNILRVGFVILATAAIAIVLLFLSIGNPNSRPAPTLSATTLRARDAFWSAFGSGRTIDSLSITDSSIEIHFPLTQLSAGAALFEGGYRFAKFACALRSTGFTAQTYRFVGSIILVDAYGNERTAPGVTAYLSRKTISLLNCGNVDGIDLSRIADQYDVSSALQ